MSVKISLGMLLTLWVAFWLGLVTGANVGFVVEDRQNATMDFDAESQVVTIGNETVELFEEYEDTEDSEELPVEAAPLRIGNSFDSLEDPEFLPEPVSAPVERGADEIVNGTIVTMMSITVAVGDPTATWVFDNRDWLDPDALGVVLSIIFILPIAAIIYGTYKKIRS